MHAVAIGMAAPVIGVEHSTVNFNRTNCYESGHTLHTAVGKIKQFLAKAMLAAVGVYKSHCPSCTVGYKRDVTGTNGSRREFYIHGSVHCNSILIRSNKMQKYAVIYLLQNQCTCFGCP